MSMEFTLNDLQRQRVEDHLALVEQVLRRSIKTNETVDGMGHDDLYQEGCIALCRAAVSYREEMGAFPAYARTVIRNYLLDRCREIQSARKNLPLLSLDAFAEMGAPEPVSPFHTEDLISDVSSDALLSHFRNRYHGTARLGIEAMELRVRGYSCADIAKLYQKKPNYIGACISRAAEKLRRERIVREFYTACTEQDKVECYPNTPAIKVQLLPVNAGERITMTQNLGQPLPRYQAFLCDGMLEVDSTAFMDYMEENDLGYIVDYKRYDADVFTGVNRRTAAVFQFHSAALRRLNKVGCQRYEGDYTRLKQKHAERRARRMAG